MGRELCWVHLSDLHMNPAHTGWDSAPLLKGLLVDLKRQREAGLRPQFLFFTGDAAFGHLGNDAPKSLYSQFERAHEFLTKVRESFDPIIPLDNTFLVPGNHDVHRENINPADTKWLNDPKLSLSEVQEMFVGDRPANKRQRESVFMRLEDYAAFLESCGYRHLLPPSQRGRLIYATSRCPFPNDKFRVGIAGLNSAWTSVGTGINEKGTLSMVGEWQIKTLRDELDDCDVRIGLLHHPMNWLRMHVDANEELEVNRALQQSFSVALHGHEHAQSVRYESDPPHLRIAAGACYEDSNRENAYSIVRLFIDEHRGEVHHGKYFKETNQWGPLAIPGRSPNGIQPLPNLAGLWGTPPVKEEVPSTDAAPITPPLDFTSRYRRAITRRFDRLELFGLPARTDEINGYQLSVAYVTLTMTGKTRGTDEDAPRFAGSAEQLFDQLGRETTRILIRGEAGSGKTTLLSWAAVQAAQFLTEFSLDELGRVPAWRHDVHSEMPDLTPATPSTLNTLDDYLGQLRRTERKHPERATPLPLVQNDSRVTRSATDRWRQLFTKPRDQCWQSKTPIFVRLRSCEAGRLPYPNDLVTRNDFPELPDPPSGWLEDLLTTGQALILFDGVDEVPEAHRATLKAELQRFMTRYPDNFYVVTMRPTATDEGWLDADGFAEARVEPMEPEQRNQLVDRWHQAVEAHLRQHGNPQSLQATGTALKVRLDAEPQLAQLARSPLLCAAICTLHREHEGNIPARETELFDQMLRCLIDRREREQDGLRNEPHVSKNYRRLSYDDRRTLLARLAYEMLFAGDSKLSATRADELLSDELAELMPQQTPAGTEIRRSLVERSGLLREVVRGEIDFVHNALKEYLAAERAFNLGDVQPLVDRMTDEAWQRVILYAVNWPQRGSKYMTRLLQGLLYATEKAISATRSKQSSITELQQIRSRQVLLLRCRTVLGEHCPLSFTQEVTRRTAALFPPQTLTDANALEHCGDAVVPFLVYQEGLPEDTQLACIRALRLIGTQLAHTMLIPYRVLTTQNISQELSLVLNPLSLPLVQQALRRTGTLPAWLPRDRITDLTPLRELKELRSLYLSGTSVSDITPFSELKELRSLYLSGTGVSDLTPLRELKELRSLNLSDTDVSDISPLWELTALQRIDLSGTGVSDVSPLQELTSLRWLSLSGTGVKDVSALRHLQDLEIYGVD